MSKKTEIRDQAITVLKNTIAGVEGRVFDSIQTPIWEEQCPCLNVATGEENPERQQGGRPRTWTRTLAMVVEVAVRGETAPADLDELCESVEDAILADPNLGGAVEDVDFQGSTSVIHADGKGTFGVAEIRFSVTYVR